MYSYEVPEVHTIHKELDHIDGSRIRLKHSLDRNQPMAEKT